MHTHHTHTHTHTTHTHTHHTHAHTPHTCTHTTHMHTHHTHAHTHHTHAHTPHTCTHICTHTPHTCTHTPHTCTHTTHMHTHHTHAHKHSTPQFFLFFLLFISPFVSYVVRDAGGTSKGYSNTWRCSCICYCAAALHYGTLSLCRSSEPLSCFAQAEIASISS